MRDRAGVAVGAALALCYGAIGWVRHTNHWTGAFDLGFFDQAVWQLSHGRTHSSLLDRSLFSDHLSLVLVLFAPLYRVVATPAWLIGGQALALGMTVLPMRALARDLGLSTRWPTALVVVSPPLLAAAVFDFHPSALAVPFIALAVLAGQRDDLRLAVLAGAAVLLCRADLGIVLLGVAVVSRPSARRTLIALGLLGAAAGTVVPEALGNPGAWDSYYGHLGAGPLDVATHPWRVVRALMSDSVVALLLGWLLGVALLPIWRPRWLVAVLVAALPVLLSRFPGPTLPWFHHGASYVPLLSGGALVALAAPQTRYTEVRPMLRHGTAIGSVTVALLLVSPWSPNAPGSTQLWRSLQHRRDISEALALVDPGDGVSASPRVVPQLSQREVVYLYPIPFAPPDFTFPAGLEPRVDAAEVRAVDVIVVEPARDGEVPEVRGFTVTFQSPDVVVLRRS